MDRRYRHKSCDRISRRTPIGGANKCIVKRRQQERPTSITKLAAAKNDLIERTASGTGTCGESRTRLNQPAFAPANLEAVMTFTAKNQPPRFIYR